MKRVSFILIFLSISLFARVDSFTEVVRVDYHKPVYETVERVIPHKHNHNCFEEYEARVNRPNSYQDNNSIGIDTIIGVASGVIIGNQVGKGNGRVAAKVIGGLLGASVANSMRNNEYHNSNEYTYETRRRNICNKRDKKIIRENILTGYENYFTYKGKTYSKFSSEKRRNIKITTTIDF